MQSSGTAWLNLVTIWDYRSIGAATANVLARGGVALRMGAPVSESPIAVLALAQGVSWRPVA